MVDTQMSLTQQDELCPSGARCEAFSERQGGLGSLESFVPLQRRPASGFPKIIDDLLSEPIPLPGGLRASATLWAWLKSIVRAFRAAEDDTRRIGKMERIRREKSRGVAGSCPDT
jgi:hypothetical protein